MWLATVLVLALGLVPAAIARSKGRRFFLWWIYGVGLFVVALPHALLLNRGKKPGEGRVAAAGGAIALGGPPAEATVAETVSITMHVKDESTARQLCDDQYFLYGTLRADDNPTARRFLAALSGGATYRYEVRRDSRSGECEVRMWIRS